MQRRGNQDYVQWRCDRFKVREQNDITDAMKHQAEGSTSTEQELARTLQQILDDKQRCDALITKIIKQMFISLANAAGVRVRVLSQGTTRKCATMKDVSKGIRDMQQQDSLDMVQFLTNFASGVLYRDMLGVTHQEATEDAVCEVLRVQLGKTRHTVGSGKKTCIGQLYGLLYNRQKQRLHCSIQGQARIYVSVERGMVPKHKNWKRNKHVYFVHEKIKNEATGKYILEKSREVCTNRVHCRLCLTRK